MPVLAYADTFDPSQSNFIFILVTAGGVAGVGILAAVVVFFARKALARWTRFFVTAVLFWALIAIGSLIAVTLQQLAWQKQFNQDLMSGYGDPQAPGPGVHPTLWATLAVVYATMLGATLALRTRNFPSAADRPRPPTVR